MLPSNSYGTVSNYDTVPLDFTGSIHVSNLQIWALKIPDVHSRELLALFFNNLLIIFLTHRSNNQDDSEDADRTEITVCSEPGKKADETHQGQHEATDG